MLYSHLSTKWNSIKRKIKKEWIISINNWTKSLRNMDVALIFVIPPRVIGKAVMTRKANLIRI